jgi:hypothetical protein
MLALLFGPSTAGSMLPTHRGPCDQPLVLGAASSGGFSAVVTWNGHDVAGANSVGSAVQADYSSQVPVVFRWFPGGLAVPVNISTARLQVYYFGSALTTTDSVEQAPVAAPAGSLNMTWTVGSLRWLTAGSYQVTASLLYAGNSSTAWSESFFLHVSAPYSVGAIVPLLMALLGVLLLYEVAISRRYATPSPATTLPTPESEAAAGGAPPTKLPEEQGGPP